MIETTEQIQNPVTPEPPLGEIPEPSLPEIPAQASAPDLSQPDPTSQDEATLSAEITQLWQVHQDCQSAIKQEAQQFRSLRSELGNLLHQMKGLLAKPGRSGGWSAWLKERRIPRATADRLVAKHELSLNPDGNCLTEQLSEPTEQEIQILFDKIAPKLRKALPTKASAYKFIDMLTASFERVDRRDTEEGILVLKPAAHSEPVMPRKSLVETSVQELANQSESIQPEAAVEPGEQLAVTENRCPTLDSPIVT